MAQITGRIDITDRVLAFIGKYGIGGWEANTVAAHAVLDDDNFDDDNLKVAEFDLVRVVEGHPPESCEDDDKEAAKGDLAVVRDLMALSMTERESLVRLRLVVWSA